MFLTALAGMTILAGTFDSADARHHAYRRHYEEPENAPKQQTAVKKPSGPMYAVVSLADQHVTFYDGSGVYARGLVSTGVPGHPTPAGLFTILEKERWHNSNIYSGAPMPWMQRLAWFGVAMHEGVVHPGQTASHGCIRMQPEFAKEIWGVTSVGQRVVISPEDVKPSDIVHAHLPVPALRIPPFVPAPEKKAANPRSSGPDGGSASKNPAVEPVALDPKAEAKPVNPFEFAQAMKAEAAAKVQSAAAAKKTAQALLYSKPAEAHAASRDLEVAEYAQRRAHDEAEDAARAASKAEGEEATKKAAERKTAAEAKLAEADAKVQQAKEAKDAKDQDLLNAQTSLHDADTAATEAAAEAKQAERRLEPVSVFISRKTGRLYVRQATVPLFDMPVTIRDADKPLGTHLFIAARPGDDGASVGWVSLTPPAAAEVHVRRHSSRRGHPVAPEEQTGAGAPDYPETAAHALDRIEIPQEAAQRIAELTWTGATLIVSDVAMSDGKFPMDFQILQETIIREYD